MVWMITVCTVLDTMSATVHTRGEIMMCNTIKVKYNIVKLNGCQIYITRSADKCNKFMNTILPFYNSEFDVELSDDYDVFTRTFNIKIT